MGMSQGLLEGKMGACVMELLRYVRGKCLQAWWGDSTILLIMSIE